jgi:hypothetical protein
LSTTEREFDAIAYGNKLPDIFAKLAGYMMELGMNYARQDDPGLHVRATQWLEEGGGRYQLRVDVECGQVRTCGLICDTEGDAVIELFTIVARSVGSGTVNLSPVAPNLSSSNAG